MNAFSLFSGLAKLAAAAALCLPFLAHAKSSPTSGSALTGQRSAQIAVGPNATTQFLFDVSGILSYEAIGNAMNEVRTMNIGANARVVGIGWDVTLFADDPSWLSEIGVSFGSSAASFVNLRPGVGEDGPGTMSFSSDGIVDLVGLGFDFAVEADGQLRMEFFEAFNDFVGDWDGRWESGTLTILTVQAIPEPGTYAMLALGLGVLGVVARRRKAA
ncbi:PEP-CTERM sorting domain-containing protein [Inhella sp.]|uniref:PEP-CTERM sorting domain-containing protein n=1 Tax=Inhella sp. TaxID=1921806 RepID=UPI0035B029FA